MKLIENIKRFFSAEDKEAQEAYENECLAKLLQTTGRTIHEQSRAMTTKALRDAAATAEAKAAHTSQLRFETAAVVDCLTTLVDAYIAVSDQEITGRNVYLPNSDPAEQLRSVQTYCVRLMCSFAQNGFAAFYSPAVAQTVSHLDSIRMHLLLHLGKTQG